MYAATKLGYENIMSQNTIAQLIGLMKRQTFLSLIAIFPFFEDFQIKKKYTAFKICSKNGIFSEKIHVIFHTFLGGGNLTPKLMLTFFSVVRFLKCEILNRYIQKSYKQPGCQNLNWAVTASCVVAFIILSVFQSVPQY